MTSIMGFDSRSMSILLSDDNKHLFSDEYPIFFKNKVMKGREEKVQFCYRNAIDTAVRYDQSRAVERIIAYLVSYQNNFYSHFLFLKNLPTIMQKGIYVEHLLNSNIINYTFDYDEWPS